jgi:hypothetical protein
LWREDPQEYVSSLTFFYGLVQAFVFDILWRIQALLFCQLHDSLVKYVSDAGESVLRHDGGLLQPTISSLRVSVNALQGVVHFIPFPAIAMIFFESWCLAIHSV